MSLNKENLLWKSSQHWRPEPELELNQNQTWTWTSPLLVLSLWHYYRTIKSLKFKCWPGDGTEWKVWESKLLQLISKLPEVTWPPGAMLQGSLNQTWSSFKVKFPKYTNIPNKKTHLLKRLNIQSTEKTRIHVERDRQRDRPVSWCAD